VADRSKFYAGQSINVKSIPAGGWKLKTIYIIGAPEYANTEPDVTFPMTGLVRITDVIFEEE
jgi:hypothetical protein